MQQITEKILKSILILAGLGVIIFIIYMITLFSAFGFFDKDYSVTDLKKNFERKKTEIFELKKYFNSIVPKNRFVEIEFDNDNTLARFGIKVLNSTGGDTTAPIFLEWDLKTNTTRMDSIIKPLGWNRATVSTIKDKLDKAHCIEVESGEPTKIGFQRSGMGMYYFNVFDKPIADSLKSTYNDSCTYILANDELVLEYGGGAIGAQCFYRKN